MNAPSILVSCFFATVFAGSYASSEELAHRTTKVQTPGTVTASVAVQPAASRNNTVKKPNDSAPDARTSVYATLTSSASDNAKRKTQPVRVLIIGDSMAATDFGRELQKKLRGRKQTRCFRKGKSSTGLARPDFYDWMGEGKRQIQKTKPNVVIVIVGGNDGQDLIDKAKKKRRVFWRGKKWETAYSERINSFVTLLQEPDRHVIWLELPAMDRKRLENKLKLIREVQKETIETMGNRAHYVRTEQHFYETSGKLIRKISDPKSRKKVPLRQEDGIHFSLAGSKYFAQRVFLQVDELLTSISQK